MLGFNTGASQISDADKRIAELEQQTRLLSQQNAQLVQEKTSRESLLRGELDAEKGNRYEQQPFSWESLVQPPREKGGTPVIPVDKLQEVVKGMVTNQFNNQLSASAQQLQQEKATQQRLMEKFKTEHPDMASDPRVVQLIAQDWAEGKALAGDRVSPEDLYSRVVTRGKQYQQMLPPPPKNGFNNPYAPVNPGAVVMGQLMGADPSQKEQMQKTHSEEIAARKAELRKKMLGQ